MFRLNYLTLCIQAESWASSRNSVGSVCVVWLSVMFGSGVAQLLQVRLSAAFLLLLLLLVETTVPPTPGVPRCVNTNAAPDSWSRMGSILLEAMVQANLICFMSPSLIKLKSSFSSSMLNSRDVGFSEEKVWRTSGVSPQPKH